jgi:hypothetical protein
MNKTHRDFEQSIANGIFLQINLDLKNAMAGKSIPEPQQCYSVSDDIFDYKKYVKKKLQEELSASDKQQFEKLLEICNDILRFGDRDSFPLDFLTKENSCFKSSYVETVITIWNALKANYFTQGEVFCHYYKPE